MRNLKQYSSKLFTKLVSDANVLVEKKRYNKALSLLKVATWIQYVFSSKFTDKKIESILKNISLQITQNYNISVGTYILYDDYAIDNLGLTQQYIRALISTKKRIIYITGKKLGTEESIDIHSEIKAARNIEHVYYIKTGKPFDDSKEINNIISSYRPEKVFMHLSPNSVEAITAFYALPEETKKYNIDIQDHAYWVGAGVVDYDIVFRSYGFNMAEYFRGIDKNNIIFQPYYPIFNAKREFEGFPVDTKEKIIVISGSAYHKVASKDNVFQKFVIRILEENPNVVYFFAGSGNPSVFETITNRKHLKDRFFLLGQRKDIFQVLQNSDIYVDTFPFCGGLMAQLAAYSNLPIMSFDYPGNGGPLESVICQKKNIKITHDALDSMYSQLVRFINNKEERIHYGQKINECVIDANWFNKNFLRILNTDSSSMTCEQFSDQFFNDEKNHNRVMQCEQEYYIWILQHLKLQSLIYCPLLLLNTFFSFCNLSGLKRICRKIKKSLYLVF